MSKCFQKPIKQDQNVRGLSDKIAVQEKDQLFPVSKRQWQLTATENKFEGMRDRVQVVQPEIIPGYKIRG